MADSLEVPTAQRAYTLRLRGIDGDTTWRDALWATHEAVNRGAKIFGDWLLTLRGGLAHDLIEMPVPQPKKDGKEQPPRKPTDEERNDRRIVLALSWLSVESEDGAPTDTNGQKYLVPKGEAIPALRSILRNRGLNEQEIQEWVDVCTRSLSAKIRADACWVNRSSVFDEFCDGCEKCATREDARKVLWHLFGKDYLSLPRKQVKGAAKDMIPDDGVESASEEEIAEEKRGAAIQSGKGAGKRTRNLFCHIFGTKVDSKFRAPLDLRQWWKEKLTPEVRKCGIPVSISKRKNDGTRSPGELHMEMFSKAAARLAQIHTKQKQQEIERQNREAADDGLSKMETDLTYRTAILNLNQFYENRAARPRQIDQWDRVVREWAKINASDTAVVTVLRIDAVKRLQNELRDEKFGDPNLFIELADENFRTVWWRDGNADPSILRTYVRGTKARADAERLKVSSYRHPDPYQNPVFCQFGVSRPHIAFRRLAPIKSGDQAADDVRAVEMLLWDGTCAKRQIRLASSKRFDREIGSACDMALQASDRLPTVSRRSRLGQFDLPGDDGNVLPHVAAVFEEPSWNGALQADRRALKAIGKYAKKGDAAKSAELRERLHWSLTVSLALQPRGPWCDFAAGHSQVVTPDHVYDPDSQQNIWVIAPKKSTDTWRGTTYPFVHSRNTDRRGSMAYHALSGIADLRVLSVDLGHRFAAACAAWETMSQSNFEEKCAEGRAKGWEVKVHELYATFEQPERETNKPTKQSQAEGRVRKFRPTTYYRRTGPDMWARLDRQFVIKLQGEEEGARSASEGEWENVRKLESVLGYQRNEKTNPLPWAVDELMSNAVRTARLGLRRHSDYARIAFRLTHKEANRCAVAIEDIPGAEQSEHLSDLLVLWYDLAHSADYRDDWAAEQWKSCIASLPGYQEPDKPDEAAIGPQRRKQRDDMRRLLKHLTEHLTKDYRSSLAASWQTQWRDGDQQWTERLKWLRSWLLPRAGQCGAERHVGGLSLTRIATIRSLWQVYKAFRYRPTPEDTRAGTKLVENDSAEGRKFGDRMLQAMEHMREQRVKQLASRIVEAALGVGSEDRQKHWEDGTKRPRRRIDDPRFASCHAVVIENLTNYRPEETRTRRENRQLMNWSSSKVKKYLSEGCQLHGLHLREISAAYTSRQDSRTGLPGIRCADVPMKEFSKARHWRTRVKQAAGKQDAESKFLLEVEKNCHDKTVLRLPVRGGDLFVSTAGPALQADLNAAANVGLRAVLDPDWAGRWWYVPAELDRKDGWRIPAKKSCAGAVCLQSWKVATDNNGIFSTSGTPLQISDDKAVKKARDKFERDKIDRDAAKGALKKAKKNDGLQIVEIEERLRNAEASLKTAKEELSAAKKGASAQEVLNLWHDCSTVALTERQFKPYDAYWNGVKIAVFGWLRKYNKLDEK